MTVRWVDAGDAAALYLAVVLGFGLVGGGSFAVGYRAAPPSVPPPAPPQVTPPPQTPPMQARASDDEEPDDEQLGDCRRHVAWLLRKTAPARRLPRSALVGHWVSVSNEGDGLAYASPGDSMRFDKEAAPPRYVWGGPPWGLQLDRDGHAVELHNVLCSEETDPAWDQRERWTIDSDGALVIE